MTPIEETSLGLGKGLYAVFETNHGEMVAKLEEEKTPETVKNFVGLATGEKEYTDPKTGKKSTAPFYDGTIFHRIIKDFMVQGGDRLGQGTGGPGFRFKDEFHAVAQAHGRRRSLDGQCRPEHERSQFFITLVATPWLDDKHSVFGKLVKGEDVLKKIGTVETGPQDRPREEVKAARRVRIVREN